MECGGLTSLSREPNLHRVESLCVDRSAVTHNMNNGTHRPIYIAIAIVLVIFFIYKAWTFHLSALDEPGRVTTFLATVAKRFYIWREARREVHSVPAASAMDASDGEMTYGMDCETCHGKDGRTPTEIGRSLYPRSPSLASERVQRWSDADLFVIIKYGIRHTGMPGFGRSEKDQQIWNLVRFVRGLRKTP